eukprot:2157103-Prymnesium_polylepis.2
MGALLADGGHVLRGRAEPGAGHVDGAGAAQGLVRLQQFRRLRRRSVRSAMSRAGRLGSARPALRASATARVVIIVGRGRARRGRCARIRLHPRGGGTRHMRARTVART